MTLKNKKILIIIGGGIAAYKSLDLIRLLKKDNVEVRAILTKSGKEFVTALSLTTLTKSKIYEDIFDKHSEAEIDHIALSRWADLIIVMPTTANFMSKLSIGKAEDLATTVLLASNKDILLVPAMNVRMWLHKATQTNNKILQDFGYLFIGPEKGEMACGEFGEGKMSSPRQIYAYLKNYFDKRNLVKKKRWKALVTTGPTREYLDPVRYISNESSGKQGYEIAIALNKLGIATTLIAGPTNLISQKGLNIKKVTTADEMLSEVKKLLPVDLAVCAAAVADFRPAEKNKSKIKKNDKSLQSINFVKNNDILEYISKNNKYRPRLVAGFSAETENLTKNSIDKMKKKHCDLIFANDVSQKGIGFNSDYNKISLIDKKGNIKIIPKNKKSFIANKIAEILLDKLLIDDRNTN
ncbi:bifunctional phosphopantothenoylcysteine decarboxylase/phosphopantothenate--cysteine ligase CoaBC [Pelagibacteraceae bacterium]|jgi:phosphopantothenoylcysteine decarboxylase / phosphopantothenate---cysteine ligase|nr:bifunctional phosphopantothenoylcysteine decarboxylase/phosphopantothenate--cysteine ligase CoaBC [Pelagibacteraceae bacterium]MDC0530316.1 bifunctional phosphopantothenoylcysteine decarboxylase/phosphopantothenate--cysteine ligase CoaBC [Pelagibacteraceae bacterium]MDC0952176.1 bifunctional phosphopantothenoylcysteine decarboxylase/phosphopantothenate--cysteine ligase CoaBC [Pelagibacteraceae bacterium]